MQQARGVVEGAQYIYIVVKMLPKGGLYAGVAFSLFARIAQKADCI